MDFYTQIISLFPSDDDLDLKDDDKKDDETSTDDKYNCDIDADCKLNVRELI